MIKFLTVGELIEKLEKCPKSYILCTNDGDIGFRYFEDDEPMVDDENKEVYI